MWIAIVGLAKKGLPTADSCPEGPKCVGLWVSVSPNKGKCYEYALMPAALAEGGGTNKPTGC